MCIFGTVLECILPHCRILSDPEKSFGCTKLRKKFLHLGDNGFLKGLNFDAPVAVRTLVLAD
jgi:hypothetical protein